MTIKAMLGLLSASTYHTQQVEVPVEPMVEATLIEVKTVEETPPSIDKVREAFSIALERAFEMADITPSEPVRPAYLTRSMFQIDVNGVNMSEAMRMRALELEEKARDLRALANYLSESSMGLVDAMRDWHDLYERCKKAEEALATVRDVPV